MFLVMGIHTGYGLLIRFELSLGGKRCFWIVTANSEGPLFSLASLKQC